MESLVQLMSLIDLNSKSLPEGEYLKACNYMKDIYKGVQRPTIRTPRRIVDSDSDSEDDDVIFELRPNRLQLSRELNQLIAGVTQRNREIKRIESRLKYLKIRQRVTVGVRKDAVRERAQQLGLRLREYTIDELRAKGHHIPDERSFYRGYLERQNLITRDLVSDLTDDLRDLKQANEQVKPRWDELHLAVHNRPRIM
jgi:hypothetical protein